jgi:peptidoglycan/xylan/chitin deacetylase (PgdA/CDA1 family)
VRDIWTRVPKPLQRRLARWFGCRRSRLHLDSPLVSFTFDDFPRSALLQGGSILRERGFVGTYYASFGLMGRRIETGEIFSDEDLTEFVHQQHELGCHTFDHCDSWPTPSDVFEASIKRNQESAARRLPGVPLRSLAYPISYPRPQTKRRVAKYYECARGGGQVFNSGTTDLNYLKAFFLEQSRDNFDAIERLIQENTLARGWLIFATHDVCESPTRFGVTPQFFKAVVRVAAQSGALILPIHQAFQRARSNWTGEPAGGRLLHVGEGAR